MDCSDLYPMRWHEDMCTATQNALYNSDLSHSLYYYYSQDSAQLHWIRADRSNLAEAPAVPLPNTLSPIDWIVLSLCWLRFDFEEVCCFVSAVRL